MSEPGLREFLIAEYNNIAEAHFKMVETISAFFKHYLAIVSIPIGLIVVIPGLIPDSVTPSDAILEFTPVLAPVFFVISLVGFMMMLHVIGMRMDALLYARTINAIRKYFFDTDKKMDFQDRLSVRVLPQSPRLPPYFEGLFFGPVIIAFALINSFFMALSLATIGEIIGALDIATLGLNVLLTPPVFFGSFFFFVLHGLGYAFLTRYREDRYLRSNIIGVDIDGVLNCHRNHFCRILEKTTGKSIDPDQITAIPVRSCDGLDVTEEDEIGVFNTPSYWTEMPSREYAASTLRKLRNGFRLKVHIFTSRPWPYLALMNANEKKHVKETWTRATKEFADQAVKYSKLARPLMIAWQAIALFAWKILPDRMTGILGGSPLDPIVRITRLWLLNKGFAYDKILVEKASDNASDPRAHIRNRFHEARTRQIRYFVEDDPIKAKKLAFICDVIFLINQPYNQSEVEFPGNIIRVESWNEIYEHLKALS